MRYKIFVVFLYILGLQFKKKRKTCKIRVEQDFDFSHYVLGVPNFFFTQQPMRRMRICFTDVFFLFWFFRPSQKNTRQPFSGTAERIFMKLLPNDSGENVVSNVVPKWGLGPN